MTPRKPFVHAGLRPLEICNTFATKLPKTVANCNKTLQSGKVHLLEKVRKTPDFLGNQVFFWCAVQDSNL